MAKKMSRRMVALSASAIAAVYFTGYLTTQPADAGLSGTATAVATSTVVPTIARLAPARTPLSTARATVTAPTTQTAPTTRGAAYRDGTYQGSGNSRRGGIGVTVTIQGGRIANVAITSASTQYPVSRIAALPGQVVSRQSAQVDRVTGATYSTQAFQQAVQQALANAAG